MARKVRSPSTRRSDCPISVALELLGDRWSLLIVRDLMFKNRRTFKDLLEGGEGVASNILAQRLRRLEQCGLVVKRPDPSDARRQLYGLTAAGIDLVDTLVELVLWSAAHFDTGAPEEQLRVMKHDRRRFIARVRAQWAAAAKDEKR